MNAGDKNWNSIMTSAILTMCFEVGDIDVIVITKLEIFSNIPSLASKYLQYQMPLTIANIAKKVIGFV